MEPLKLLGAALLACLMLPILVVRDRIGARKVPGEVREKIFVELGGIEQFINIRGKNVNNPVIIWLHGGPGGPDSYATNGFQKHMEQDYTFIRWDQRGAGRTYFKNKTAPVSFALLLGDLDALVDYAARRFGQPVFIAGRSWGTVPGIQYAAEHPQKIAGYVGSGQEINFVASERLAATAAVPRKRGPQGKRKMPN